MQLKNKLQFSFQVIKKYACLFLNQNIHSGVFMARNHAPGVSRLRPLPLWFHVCQFSYALESPFTYLPQEHLKYQLNLLCVSKYSRTTAIFMIVFLLPYHLKFLFLFRHSSSSTNLNSSYNL